MFKRKVVLMALLLLLLSTTGHAKIVFSSERNGVEGVYVMDDDGSNQTLLIEGRNTFPKSWTPDGKQILFNRGSSVLFLMNPDGTNIRQLTENDNNYIGKCSFSPDGKFIVYNRLESIDNNQIPSVEVLNIKTGKREVISDLNVTFCDWSPDGKHIIFARPSDVGLAGDVGGNTIWIMGADGHNPRELIPNPFLQADNFAIHRSKPRWSPDGQKIVWTEMERKWEVVPNIGIGLFIKAHRYMIYDLRSKDIRQLKIPKDYHPFGIDWMDEGASVVFSARAGMPLNEAIHGVQEKPPCYIYKYHIRTGDITQLTHDPGWDQTVDWISDDVLPVSPQGKKKVTWGTVKQQGSE